MPLAELKSKYRKASSVEKVSKGWQEEYDTSSKQVPLLSLSFYFKCLLLKVIKFCSGMTCPSSSICASHVVGFCDLLFYYLVFKYLISLSM